MFVCLLPFPECCNVFNTCTCTGPLCVHPALPSAPAPDLQHPGPHQRRTHMAGWANRLIQTHLLTLIFFLITENAFLLTVIFCISGHVNASFCPHGYGCRSVVMSENQIILDVTDYEVILTLRVPDRKTLWLVSVIDVLLKVIWIDNNNDTSISLFCVSGLCAGGAREHLQPQLFVWGATGQILRLHQHLWTKQLLHKVWCLYICKRRNAQYKKFWVIIIFMLRPK